MLKRSLLLVFTCLLLFPVCHAAAPTDSSLEKIERELEVWRYQALARVQAMPDNHLLPFSTDGCSGGLSDGWRFLAKTLPAFKHKFGDKPPYESCCVEHDRAYWRGETEQGFDRRLQADRRLQQCVQEFGKTHRDEFARQFNLSAQTIETNFEIVAALMYRAVRVGGGPCTVFPWRWGYGWPMCQELDE
jgi:hypothetical protein